MLAISSLVAAAQSLNTAQRPLGLPHEFAHRGGWGRSLQNTVANLQAAAATGANIEYDVRRTADGVLVIHHDPKIRGVDIARTPFAALPRLEDGSVVATIDQALAVGVGTGVKQMIEIKEDGYEAQVLDAVARSGAQPGSIFFQSFKPSSIQALHKLRPDIPAGLLIGLKWTDPLGRRALSQAAAIGADYVLPMSTLATNGFLARAQAKHLPVVAWSPWMFNDTKRAVRLIADPRVASVITNQRALAVDETRATSPALN